MRSKCKCKRKWPVPALADDILREIFLRIASPADLARDSAACASFHRLISDPAFLRRYRSLHSPLLGLVGPEGFRPVTASHPGFLAGRALARVADFSFNNYIPPGRAGPWCPCDAIDGRVLLEPRSPLTTYGNDLALPDLAACDPLSRGYLLLPPVPGDLLAAVHVRVQNVRGFQALLVPASGDDDGTTLRVIVRTRCETKLAVFQFSSDSGQWIAGASASWDDLGLGFHARELGWPSPQYAHGCFYWKVPWTNKLLKLDTSRMEFSTLDLPLDHDRRKIFITDAGGGRLGMLSHTHSTCVTSMDYYIMMQNDSEKANQWLMKSMLQPPASHNCVISDAAEGYIFLLGIRKAGDPRRGTYFSVEVKTLEIKRVGRTRFPFRYVDCAYFGFPPSYHGHQEGYELRSLY